MRFIEGIFRGVREMWKPAIGTGSFERRQNRPAITRPIETGRPRGTAPSVPLPEQRKRRFRRRLVIGRRLSLAKPAPWIGREPAFECRLQRLGRQKSTPIESDDRAAIDVVARPEHAHRGFSEYFRRTGERRIERG